MYDSAPFVSSAKYMHLISVPRQIFIAYREFGNKSACFEAASSNLSEMYMPIVAKYIAAVELCLLMAAKPRRRQLTGMRGMSSRGK